MFDKGDVNVSSLAARLASVTSTVKAHLQNVEVYPSMGNHDVYPNNVEEFSDAQASPVINAFYENWHGQFWLNDTEIETYHNWGYYAKPIRYEDKAKPGTWIETKGKLISLNTQACNQWNWALLHDRQDPGHMVEWLEHELSEAEKDLENGAFVWIIGHIPPNDCLNGFSSRL